MKTLYVFIFLCTLAGSVLAQGSPGFEGEQPERMDSRRGISIYPNPTSDFIIVSFKHINVDQMTVSMHNIIGNEIAITPERIDEHELKIPVKDFDAGYYLLALKDEQSNFRGTYKFLKR